jgi:hypothetical protein
MSHLLHSTYQVELPELKEKMLPGMGKYTNAHLLCSTYQVALPELNERWLPRMGKYTNALPPLWHLPSRIARIEGEKVVSNGEIHKCPTS